MAPRGQSLLLGLASALAVSACGLILPDTFSFSPGDAGGSGGSSGQGQGAGSAGSAGGDACPRGGQVMLRIANVLDETRPAHLCIRYPGEAVHYVAQSAAHGFVDGMPPATVTRYRSISSGPASIGLSSADAAAPCKEPSATLDLCLPSGAYGTVVMAGDRGASPPTAALEFLQDLSPDKVDPSRFFSRFVHATPAPGDPWMDAVIWSTVSAEWILPFHGLQFGSHPVAKKHADAFNPINDLGYISGYFGIDTVKTLQVVLPLSIDIGGVFQPPQSLLDAYHSRPPSTPVTTLAWGNLSPLSGLDAPSYPGLRLLSCVDDPEPGLGASECFEMPRVDPAGLVRLPRFRAGNLSPSPVRYCMLPYSSANTYAPKSNRPGWKEMPPEGIVVPPFTLLRDRVLPFDDYVILSLPTEQTCDQAEGILAASGYNQDSCTTSNLACDDFIASAMAPEHLTATVVFDGKARRPIFYTVRPTPGMVTARLSNVMSGDEPLDASLDGTPLWPDVKPNLTYFHAGVYSIPPAPPKPNTAVPTEVEAAFPPAPGARFRWTRKGQKAVSADPVAFAGEAGKAFVLWAGGDASLLGTDAPDSPFLFVCSNDPADAPSLDCQRIPMVPDE